MDLAQELLRLGPSGLICVVLLVGLYKSEKREALKDLRIQMLENQLTESYDERVQAADRVADALHGNAEALRTLTSEVKGRRR